MAKKVRDTGIRPDQLLAELPLIEPEKKDLAESIKDAPLESQLLSLSDISVDRESELLHRFLVRIGKCKG